MARDGLSDASGKVAEGKRLVHRGNLWAISATTCSAETVAYVRAICSHRLMEQAGTGGIPIIAGTRSCFVGVSSIPRDARVLATPGGTPRAVETAYLLGSFSLDAMLAEILPVLGDASRFPRGVTANCLAAKTNGRFSFTSDDDSIERYPRLSQLSYFWRTGRVCLKCGSGQR